MRLVLYVLNGIVSVLACWTLAYHFMLFSRLPSGWIFIPFALITIAVVAALNRGRGLRVTGREVKEALPVLLLGLAIGLLSMITDSPNIDDYSFFHRAATQLDHLDQPIFLTHTGDNMAGLPPLSQFHVTTSIEPLTAFLGHWLHIDPLWVYQKGLCPIYGLLLVCAYYALYRQVRLRPRWALACTALGLIFLILDGNEPRSFGAWGIIHYWQGKAMLVIVWVALLLFYGLRYLRTPTRANFFAAALCVISAVGLSSSGLYVNVIVLGALLASFVTANGFRKWSLKRAVRLSPILIYPCMIVGAAFVGLLPHFSDFSVWVSRFPATWTGAIKLVVPNNLVFARWALAAFVLSFFALCGRGKAILIYPFAIVVFCLNGIAGPIWMKLIYPAAYWRLVYAIPFPWFAGLSGRLFARTKTAWIGAAFIAFSAWSNKFTALDPRAGVLYTSPLDLRFAPVDWTFYQQAKGYLHESNLLAPAAFECVAALRDLSIKVECGRPGETLHIFTNAGMKSEGVRRVEAQMFLTGDVSDGPFLSSADHVDTIVAPIARLPQVQKALLKNKRNWTVLTSNENYALLKAVR
jgi:Family of unknown function (DUF6077)